MTGTEKLILDTLYEIGQKMDSISKRMEEGLENLNDRIDEVESKAKMTHKKLNNLALDMEEMKKDV